MTPERRLLLASLLLGWLGMVLACGGGGGKTYEPLRLPGPEEKLISYEVLKKRKLPDNEHYGKAEWEMDLLVNERATKAEVMKLAEWLAEKNEGRLLLNVFDSREVWEYLTPGDTDEQLNAHYQRFPKEREPEMKQKCKKHNLAGIGVNTNGKAVWDAVDRDH
jgi:hypothetical protein